MEKQLKIYFYCLTLAIVLYSCKEYKKDYVFEKGKLNVEKYVAIGNSLTAGISDGALYAEGQKNGYANILAQQFKLIGGGEFKQPLVSENSVGIGGGGTSKLILGYKADCKNVNSLSPVRAASIGDLSALTNIYATQGPFNNMGIPSLKMINALQHGYAKLNPFFGRFCSNPNTSVLQDAMYMNPTFFTFYLGNNDILLYAANGGARDSITPSAGPVGVGFDATAESIIDALTQNGAKGAIGNISDVTVIPYFTTIPYNGLILDAPTAALLTAAYQNKIIFKEGANPFIIADKNVPGAGLRPMQPGELVLLSIPGDSIKCANWGSVKPIPNEYILTLHEMTLIKNALQAYNNKLRNLAEIKGLAYVDANTTLANVKSGIVYNGVNVNTEFITGGAFSLDGIHLTPKGNAILANEFIKSINNTYGSNIPLVDINSYRGVQFP